MNSEISRNIYNYTYIGTKTSLCYKNNLSYSKNDKIFAQYSIHSIIQSKITPNRYYM